MSHREKGHIKSRERVRELGEVYTQPREVAAMLDLIPEMFDDIDYRFLEPACGNGNFLVAILRRKIAGIREEAHGGTPRWYEFALLRSLASIYAVDISAENVHEARCRMSQVLIAALPPGGAATSKGAFDSAVDVILASNIVVGDSLNDASSIVFVEYEPQAGETFARKPSHLTPPEIDLFYTPPQPLPTVHFSELGN